MDNSKPKDIDELIKEWSKDPALAKAIKAGKIWIEETFPNQQLDRLNDGK